MWLKSRTFNEFEQDYEARLVREPQLNKKKTSKKDLHDYYDQLQKLCDTLVRSRGVMRRIYRYSLNTPSSLGGRLFCGGSIQGLACEYRSLLLRDSTTDIDMKNAHPVILLYICKKHSVDCAQLESYVNNRDAILAKWSDRGIGKTAYLENTNNEKHSGVKDETPEVNKLLRLYANENKTIQKKLLALPDYAELQNSIPDEKLWNRGGSGLNRILCYYENIILSHCLHVLNVRNIEVCVFMFDGLMAYGNHYQDPGLLTEIETYVESQMEGLNMKWDYKQHDTVHTVPEGFDERNVLVEKEGVLNDRDAAETVFKLYPHWVCCQEELFVFDDSTGLWSNNDSSHFKVISKFDSQLYLLTKNKDGVSVKSTKGYGNSTVLQRLVIPQIKALCINDAWMNQTQSSSLGKVLFNNGYYDFKTSKFYDKFDPKIVFMNKIPHNFVAFSDEEMVYMEGVEKRLFVDPLGAEVADYWLLNLARGLAGDLMKRILFGLGSTDCGKSTITTACKTSLGGYFGSFNGESLAYRNCSQDEAAQMRWVMLLRYKRLIFSNEMKSTVELNGNMIKKISSGGDSIIGRTHGNVETDFVPQFLTVCMANDINKIKPYDKALSNRTRVIPFNNQFVEEPSNEFQLKKDINIAAEMETLLFQRVFVGLLIRRYMKYVDSGKVEVEPAEVVLAKNEWIGDENEVGFVSQFLTDFEITNNVKDFVPSSYIDEWLKHKNLGVSMKCFGAELRKHCIISKFTNVSSKDKKINGKNVKAWFGIKEIRVVYDSPSDCIDDDNATEVIFQEV